MSTLIENVVTLVTQFVTWFKQRQAVESKEKLHEDIAKALDKAKTTQDTSDLENLLK